MGTFEKSIEALRRLNAVGYGNGNPRLRLTLMYNPVGAFLAGFLPFPLLTVHCAEPDPGAPSVDKSQFNLFNPTPTKYLRELTTETWDTVLFSVSLAIALLALDAPLALVALAPVPLSMFLAHSTGR